VHELGAYYRFPLAFHQLFAHLLNGSGNGANHLAGGGKISPGSAGLLQTI